MSSPDLANARQQLIIHSLSATCAIRVQLSVCRTVPCRSYRNFCCIFRGSQISVLKLATFQTCEKCRSLGPHSRMTELEILSRGLLVWDRTAHQVIPIQSGFCRIASLQPSAHQVICNILVCARGSSSNNIMPVAEEENPGFLMEDSGAT